MAGPDPDLEGENVFFLFFLNISHIVMHRLTFVSAFKDVKVVHDHYEATVHDSIVFKYQLSSMPVKDLLFIL